MSKDKLHKIEVTAPLHTEVATLANIAEALSLPKQEERQPDLQYLTAIFVSSGINKNGAVFLGSELVKARKTISNKAVDIEHDEQRIIGQITGNVFLNRDRSVIDVEYCSTLPMEDVDEMDMDIGITAIIHKSRFPEISQEILAGEWMVSMEAYYRDFDIKVGDMIIPREKAEEMGFDKLVGSVVQLKDKDKEMGFHLVGRVLRDILFAGVGIVKNPANPRSVIMEAAALNEYIEKEAQKGPKFVINLADMGALSRSSAEVVVDSTDNAEETKKFIKEAVFEAVSEAFKTYNDTSKEDAGLDLNYLRPGTCVNYKRYVYDYPKDTLSDEPATDLTQYPLSHQPGPAGVEYPGAKIVAEHYCNLFDLECTARPGDATLPNCWRNVFARTVREEIDSHEEVLRRRRIQEGLVSLQHLLDEARKFKQ